MRFPLRPFAPSIGTVGSDAANGVVELVDLVAEVIARLRIDDRNRGRDREACRVPDRTCHAGGRLHDPRAEPDAAIGQRLPGREPAANSCCAPTPISHRWRRCSSTKQLWTVERTFRTAKSLFETRPIYHKLDETIRGHVACSFLALVLKKELEDRLAAANTSARASWPEVIADLNSLTETEVEQDGKRFLLRSAPRPAAALAFSALGVALPPTLRQIADA